MFYLTKYMFDSIPVSVTLCLQSEDSSLEYSLVVFRAVNEKYGGFDLMLLPQFFTHYFGGGCRGRKTVADDGFRWSVDSQWRTDRVTGRWFEPLFQRQRSDSELCR